MTHPEMLTPKKTSRTLPLLMLGCLTAMVLALGWSLVGSTAPPRLDTAADALASGDYDAARTAALRFLNALPENASVQQQAPVRLILARIALEQSEPDPASALDMLRPLEVGKLKDARVAAEVLVLRGKADLGAKRLAAALSAWREALRLDPLVAEAGWLLIQLYDTQGRHEEAADLALDLFQREPDPGDRVRLLMEPTRQSAQTLAANWVISFLEPAAVNDPQDAFTLSALGVALAKEGRTEDAKRILADNARQHPNDPNVFDAWCIGLNEAGDPATLAQVVAQLPVSCRNDPRFHAHRARAAQHKQDMPAALEHYKLAVAAFPYDLSLHFRYVRALRTAGKDPALIAKTEERRKTLERLNQELKSLYEEITKSTTLDLNQLQTLADLRENLGRPREALAWHELVLERDPQNERSRDARDRLRSITPLSVGGNPS